MNKSNNINFTYLPNSFIENFGESITNIISEKDIEKLKTNSLITKGNNVSDFTDWIFDTIIPISDLDQHLKDGKTNEKSIYESLIYNVKIDKSDEYFRREYYEILNKDWILEFEDLSENNIPFKISNLTINNVPLYGKPDIVYRNKR